MTIRLKAGRYYQRADGTVHGPIEKREHDYFPFFALYPHCASYTSLGKWCLSPHHEYDLIRECTRTGAPIRRRKAQDSKYPYDHRVQPKARKAVAALVEHVQKMPIRPPRKRKARVATFWAFTRINDLDGAEPRWFYTRAAAIRNRSDDDGAITKLSLPLPAGKGKKM